MFLFFAKIFKIFISDGETEETKPKEEESWDDEFRMTYHTLNLPRSSILMIDTVEKFEKFLDVTLKDVCIVGIDSEWKPSFSKCRLIKSVSYWMRKESNYFVFFRY